MNELKEICERLNHSYGSDASFEVVRAEKTENGWNLTVQLLKTEKDGGAENESNK